MVLHSIFYMAKCPNWLGTHYVDKRWNLVIVIEKELCRKYVHLKITFFFNIA